MDYIGGCGGFDGVDEEMDMREANFLVREENIFVSRVSKIFKGAKIFKGRLGHEILICYIRHQSSILDLDNYTFDHFSQFYHSILFHFGLLLYLILSS